MSPRNGAAWSAVDDGRVRAYRCAPRKSSGRCTRPAFALESRLLELVYPTFWRLLGGDLVARPIEQGQTARRVTELEAQRSRLVVLRDGYRDDPDIQAALPPRAFADGRQTRQRRVDDIDRAIAEEIVRSPAITADVTTLQLQWSQIDVETRRRMLHAAIGAIAVRAPQRRRDHSVPLAQRARALLPVDLPANLPRPGRNPAPLIAFPSFDDTACPWVPLG